MNAGGSGPVYINVFEKKVEKGEAAKRKIGFLVTNPNPKKTNGKGSKIK